MRHKIRNSLLFAALAASSSIAFAGTPYVGFDAGLAIARSNDVDETVTYLNSAGTPSSETIFYDDVYAVEYDKGYDVGLVAGYDLGWFRLEAEFAQKRVSLDRYEDDDITPQFLADVNERLLRTGSGTAAPLTIADFQPSGSLRARSAMLNGILEANVTRKVTVSGGGGIGRSFVSGLGGKDQALAWQYMAGVRTKVADRMSVGVKYRYFNSGIVKLENGATSYAGGSSTVSADVKPDLEGKFRSRSLLLGLTYDLR